MPHFFPDAVVKTAVLALWMAGGRVEFATIEHADAGLAKAGQSHGPRTRCDLRRRSRSSKPSKPTTGASAFVEGVRCAFWSGARRANAAMSPGGTRRARAIARSQ